MKKRASTTSAPRPAKELLISVDESGAIALLHDDEFNALLNEGEARISRASHCEPSGTQWIADLAPVDGPLLGPFPSRAAALAAEVDWLNANYL